MNKFLIVAAVLILGSLTLSRFAHTGDLLLFLGIGAGIAFLLYGLFQKGRQNP